MTIDDLAARVTALRAERGHPVVVGVSGWCGSGKSTLARALVGRVDGAVRLRGDDFLDPERSHRRSSDWDGVDRKRLRDGVLVPFRRGVTSTFRRYDWSARRLGPSEPLPSADVLIVDLIGLFHPDVVDELDLRVWCDVDLEVAVRRGIARDRELGRAHDHLWHDVWEPNERDFAERFDPRAAADVIVATEDPADALHRARAFDVLRSAPIGARVVVRYRLGDGATDALGDLVARTDTACTVRTRRGDVVVALAAVVAARPVPPPPAPRRPRDDLGESAGSDERGR